MHTSEIGNQPGAVIDVGNNNYFKLINSFYLIM